MLLIEVTTIPDAALPVEPLKAHLRLGTGFGEDTLQDDVLKGFLRAAIAAIEARTGKVLLSRSFAWTLVAWRNGEGQALPVAPVSAVTQVVLSDKLGTETVVDAGSYRLEVDTHRPKLRPMGSCLATIPTGGSARVEFDAGIAADWDGLPNDLGQAVLLLAAHYYEYRSENQLSDGCMPFGVTSLIQRYRLAQISVGGA